MTIPVEDTSALPNPFPGDSYDTPDNHPRPLLSRLSLGWRGYFYIRNFNVFRSCGYRCKRNIFTPVDQIEHSVENVRITEDCGGRIHLRGLDNLVRFPGPAVIIGNHMSLLETALMHAFIRPRRDFTFVIKKSLLDVPYFGDLMRTLEAVSVGRENPKEDFKTVMEEGARTLAKGKSLVVFPQSTRSETFKPSEFNTIGVKLAKKTGAPIIPLALRTDCLGNGRLVKDLGPLRPERPVWFEFGEPMMKVSGSGREEHSAIVEFIKGRLAEWGGAIEEASNNTGKEN